MAAKLEANKEASPIYFIIIRTQLLYSDLLINIIS